MPKNFGNAILHNLRISGNSLPDLKRISHAPFDPVGPYTGLCLDTDVGMQVISQPYPAPGTHKPEPPVIGMMKKIGSKVTEDGQPVDKKMTSKVGP